MIEKLEGLIYICIFGLIILCLYATLHVMGIC